MNRNERILVWLLRLGGAVMLTALGAVVMPFDWMNSIHRQVGLGELPHVPIVGYLTRSISALYTLHGALLVFMAGTCAGIYRWCASSPWPEPPSVL